MAAINAIAKDWADELRDGIAWVIVWKTGRSWNATAVWLNSDDDTFEPEDLEQARKILAQDPNAVMLNGYYCGHFGEDMTVAELAAGIRWHYENGYNLLDGSTAFPPEPMERPADLPASLPWYGKATSTEPEPYTYDGYMSPEDFELMHKNMEADRQREKSPPEGPTAELTLTFTPETAAALLEAITPPLLRAVQYAAEVARKAWDAFMEVAKRQRQSRLIWRANSWTLCSAPRTTTRNGGTITSTQRSGACARNTRDGWNDSSMTNYWPPLLDRR